MEEEEEEEDRARGERQLAKLQAVVTVKHVKKGGRAIIAKSYSR